MIKYVLDERNLRTQKAETIARAKFMLQSLEPEIFQFLDTIPYAMINGEALSVTAYGDVGYRTSMDFDFLVSVRHSKAIKEIFFNMLNFYMIKRVIQENQLGRNKLC